MSSSIKIGTCSWNYPSWAGLVYSSKSPNAAGYLKEYADHFSTVEIDSWFYKVPGKAEVFSYLEQAGSELTFSCKMYNRVTLTHLRQGKKTLPLQKNPDFLSLHIYNEYISAIEMMFPRIDAVELEFEYLNREYALSCYLLK